MIAAGQSLYHHAPTFRGFYQVATFLIFFQASYPAFVLAFDLAFGLAFCRSFCLASYPALSYPRSYPISYLAFCYLLTFQAAFYHPVATASCLANLYCLAIKLSVQEAEENLALVAFVVAVYFEVC